MQTLLLQMAGGASPSAVSVLAEGGWTDTSSGFHPLLLPLMLVIAVATALTLKIVGFALNAIAGAVKSVVETSLALAGLVAVMLVIMFALTVILRSPT